MKLYHAGMSTCSQKVRMALAEKQLSFSDQDMNLQNGDQYDPTYLKLNPQALVPTLEDQGLIFCESTLINEYLDDAYPEHPLKPVNAAARFRMRALVKQIDEVQHPACSVITYAIALRPMMIQKDPAELQALVDQIRDPARREARRQVLAEGVQAPVFRTALLQYMEVLHSAEKLLADTQWLAHDNFSLADCALTPYVLRLVHLGQAAQLEKLPALARWYAAVQQRPSWEIAIASRLPEKAVNTFTSGGKAVEQLVTDML